MTRCYANVIALNVCVNKICFIYFCYLFTIFKIFYMFFLMVTYCRIFKKNFFLLFHINFILLFFTSILFSKVYYIYFYFSIVLITYCMSIFFMITFFFQVSCNRTIFCFFTLILPYGSVHSYPSYLPGRPSLDLFISTKKVFFVCHPLGTQYTVS